DPPHLTRADGKGPSRKGDGAAHILRLEKLPAESLESPFHDQTVIRSCRLLVCNSSWVPSGSKKLMERPTPRRTGPRTMGTPDSSSRRAASSKSSSSMEKAT